MKKFVSNNKFLMISIILLIVLSVIDINYTYRSIENTRQQIVSMLIIVPPIFVLIGLFDAWVPRQTMIVMMGKESGIKGMAIAFVLGAFSAGPTIAAFPLAMVMLKKGARYANVIFFIMVWSSLKLPIVFYQFSQLGFQFAMVINLTMLLVFITAALFAEKLYTTEQLDAFEEKAAQHS